MEHIKDLLSTIPNCPELMYSRSLDISTFFASLYSSFLELVIRYHFSKKNIYDRILATKFKTAYDQVFNSVSTAREKENLQILMGIYENLIAAPSAEVALN